MFKKIYLSTVIFLSALFLYAPLYTFAQEIEEDAAVEDSIIIQDISNQGGYPFFSFQDGGLSEEINPFWTPEETDFKRNLRYTILVGVPVVQFVYGVAIWDWGENSDWRWGRERWFQADTSSGGADKTGHFFAHYMVSRLCYSVFSYTEQSQNRALFYSAFTAFITGLLIEIGDAYTGEHGFSYEDLVANNLGIVAAVILDKYPVADEFIGITAHYWPTKGFRENDNKGALNFAGDYSGWKYMVNFKLAGFRYVGYDIPEFMRYIQLDLGYYTRDYTQNDRKEKGADNVNPTRYWFFGASVNMREVARDTFRSNRRAAWLVEQPFKYYHVPIGYKNEQSI